MRWFSLIFSTGALQWIISFNCCSETHNRFFNAYFLYLSFFFPLIAVLPFKLENEIASSTYFFSALCKHRGFISPISREDGSALVPSTRRGFRQLSQLQALWRKLRRVARQNKRHLLLSFCGIYLVPGGLKSSTKIRWDGCSPLPFQCLLREAQKGFASCTLELCAPEPGIR